MYKVLKSFKGSPDGYTVIDYSEDTEVDLVPDLAAVALKEKWVKKIAEKAAPAVPPSPTFDGPGAPIDPDITGN